MIATIFMLGWSISFNSNIATKNSRTLKMSRFTFAIPTKDFYLRKLWSPQK